MANVGAGFDVFRSIVDGGAVFDRIARGSRPARPSALVTAGQIAPEEFALAGGAIDEGVDGLEPQGAQTALVAGLEPSGNLFGRPSFRKTIADESPQFLIFLVDTQGLPLRIVIHSAGVQDRDGAALVLGVVTFGPCRVRPLALILHDDQNQLRRLPLPSRHYPAGDLALCPVHPERCRSSQTPAEAAYNLAFGRGLTQDRWSLGLPLAGRGCRRRSS